MKILKKLFVSFTLFFIFSLLFFNNFNSKENINYEVNQISKGINNLENVTLSSTDASDDFLSYEDNNDAKVQISNTKRDSFEITFYMIARGGEDDYFFSEMGNPNLDSFENSLKILYDYNDSDASDFEVFESEFIDYSEWDNPDSTELFTSYEVTYLVKNLTPNTAYNNIAIKIDEEIFSGEEELGLTLNVKTTIDFMPVFWGIFAFFIFLIAISAIVLIVLGKRERKSLLVMRESFFDTIE